MRQDIRRLIGAALLGVAAASFGTLFWLTFRIIGSRPTHPVPALGLIVPFNDKGTNYFVTHTGSCSRPPLVLEFLVARPPGGRDPELGGHCPPAGHAALGQP